MASPKTPEQRLNAEAKKATRERDALQAMREYHAEQARIDANTARLRALRLAREAAAATESDQEPASESSRSVAKSRRSS